MAAQIEVDATSGVVSGRGEIDLSCADGLRDAIAVALQVDATRTVVIDLRDVTFIDSTGVKELIRPTMDGHSVALRRPSDPVQRALKLSGLYSTVTIEAD
jgi:anti-anti-sigma factor